MISNDQEKEIKRITEEYGEDAAEEIRNLDQDEYLKYSGYNEDELTFPKDIDPDQYQYEDYLGMAFEIEKRLKNTDFSEMPLEEVIKELEDLKKELEYDENEERNARDHMRRTEIREDIKYEKEQIELASLRLKQIEIMKKADEIAERKKGR